MNGDRAGADPPSWYLATAVGLVRHPVLEGTVDADVCVIGGGYTGLSAALHLAERGYSVALLEAETIASGASGRNGGQVGTGQRRDEEELENRFGRVTAHRMFEIAEEAKATVRERIARHHIECDLRTGQLICAAKPGHLVDLERRAEKLARDYGYTLQRPLDRSELRALLDSPLYHGGCLDAGALHLHPLNYALGLARACTDAGVRVFEHSRVNSRGRRRGRSHADDESPADPGRASPAEKRVRVRAARGEVRAEYVVLACNAYLAGLAPELARRIMPINNFMLATAPLGAESGHVLAEPYCAHDTLFVVNYFRRSLDGRLIFGGGETYGQRFPHDLRAFVRRHMLKVFPQLDRVQIEHAWGGTLAITANRLPHFGRLGRRVYFAQGYSGNGIAMATLAGRLIAEALSGTTERFDVFAKLPPPAFPGGTVLRWPGQVLGMLWYAMRDRL